MKSRTYFAENHFQRKKLKFSLAIVTADGKSKNVNHIQITRKWKRSEKEFHVTLVRMRGEIPESANQRAMNSTMGVFPLPPQVKFPTLITGTGNLQPKIHKVYKRWKI